MTLSLRDTTLTGESKLWTDRFFPGTPPFFGSKGTPADAFADNPDKLTVTVTVTDSGQATFERGINGKPIGGPGATLVKLSPASYSNGLFAQAAKGKVVSVSFTLGTDRSN
jgi:hypothetical protein